MKRMKMLRAFTITLYFAIRNANALAIGTMLRPLLGKVPIDWRDAFAAEWRSSLERSAELIAVARAIARAKHTIGVT